MKRFLWLLIPSMIFAFTLGVLWNFAERKIAQFLVLKARETAARELKWNLQVENLQIHLAPPGLEITRLQMSPITQSPWMRPLKARSIMANLDFLNLLAGQIKISIIRISGLTTTLSLKDIPPSDEPIERLPIKELFSALDVFPIKMVFLEHSSIGLIYDKNQPPFALKGDVLLQSAPQTINYAIKLTAQTISGDAALMKPINLKSRGTLTEKNLNINELETLMGESKLGLQGEFVNFSKVIRSPLFSGVIDLSVDAEGLLPWLRVFSVPTPQRLTAQWKTQGQIKISRWDEPELAINMDVANASINDYTIGSLNAQMKLQKNHLLANDLFLKHPSGEVQLLRFDWNLKTDDLRSEVDLKKLNLQKLLNEIHLKEIPVELLVKARLKCGGRLITKFGLECKGQVQGEGLDVRSQFKGPPPPIVTLGSFSGEGSLTVDSNEVTYSSSVVLPNSRGQSQGVINYQSGFVIDFDANEFNFKDIPLVAGLKFEGKAKVRGRTQGNSSTATLDLSLATQDFWFEDFGLGSIEGKVSYQKGHLLIDAPKALLFNSQYLAQIDVDLNKSRIKGLAESPSLNVNDAMQALSRRVPVPFRASGTGKTRAQFEGPFELGKMTYHFEGLMENGDIQGETYDEIRWDFVAKDGAVTIENNTLRKGQALITVNGKAAPSGHLALEINGNNFKLENSTLLSKYVKTLGGDIEFEMSVTNHILKPDVYLEGKIIRTTLGDSELPDSRFIFETDSFARSLSLDLLGQQLRLDLDLPYKELDASRLFLEVKDFDFTQLLGLLTGSPLRNDYVSLLNLRMDLQSATNNIFNASGSLRIDDFYIARGEHFLRNTKPMFINFEDGRASLKDFSIKGFQSEITATGQNFTPQNLKLNLGGSMDLRLFQMFTPFLDNISGPVKGQISVAGSLQSPEVYGNVDLHEVAVKLKDFPAVFDHIDSHLEFSQKRIIIESIRGSLAGGTLSGDGDIILNGIKDVRVNVKAQLKNIQLEVPENIQSSGSADLVFSGNWFPYTLSGSYRVTQAFIDKDFASDTSESALKQSIYLPKSIAGSSMDVVVLDLQVLLDKKVEIKNPQMSGFLTGQLQVKGPPNSPILLGSIKTLPQAQLFFRDKIFDVQSGLIRFNDPTELNPDLYFTARSIVDKYEVNLLLQGRAKALQFSLTSQPTLPEQDIISLLALGVTTQKLDGQIQSSQQAAQTGYQLGTAIISANPLNKEIKQSLGVDVKFSSGFDDTKNVALPRVTVSKELIPRKLNASATSSFSEKQQYDVRFQYRLNDRFSTVVTYEKAEGQEGTAITGTSQPETSIFGLDLEYKVEFK